MRHQQLSLFSTADVPQHKESTSGSFVDNMGLPVHRWFRYSAGFSAAWAEDLISREAREHEVRVFDPFAGNGVYVPAIEWLGKLATAAGFKSFLFEKTRDRNIKWKNRKHRVPLCEGRLWVEG